MSNFSKIKAKFYTIFDNIFTDDDMYSEDTLSLILYFWMMTCACSTLLVFVIYDFFIQRYFISSILLLSAMTIFACIYTINRKVSINIIYNISSLVFLVLFSFLIYTSKDVPERVLWGYVFPIAIIAVRGIKTGLKWNLAFVTIVIFILIFFLSNTYTKLFFITYIAIYIVITLIVYWIEFYKNKYYLAIKSKNIKLENEIARRQELENTLVKMSQIDSLTNLLNQKFFWTNVQKEIDKAKRYDTQMFMAIIDIDNFKQINDNFGHLIGDTIIKMITKNIHKSVRKTDIAGRIGGDEFGILLLNIDKKQAFEKMEELRKSIYKYPFQVAKGKRVSISIGVAKFTKDLENSESLYKNADAALYKAKLQGRNKIAFWA